jgi:hypothetical protein
MKRGSKRFAKCTQSGRVREKERGQGGNFKVVTLTSMIFANSSSCLTRKEVTKKSPGSKSINRRSKIT